MASPILVDHFRCPETLGDICLNGTLRDQPGYFRFGKNAVCFGRTSTDLSVSRAADSNALADAFYSTSVEGTKVSLPFDPSEVLSNLKLERYFERSDKGTWGPLLRSLVRKTYYALRPILPDAPRRLLQRTYLARWKSIPFPAWPVDFSVEGILEGLLRLSMSASGLDRIPFIWFWPEGHASCVVITHDVEYPPGLDFVPRLMDLDESFGFKSSFQLVPEVRYAVTPAILDTIRKRGFEINVHDLSHDGELFRERSKFLRLAPRINQYGKHFQSQGFRSGALYRNLDWYDALDFSYDLSVPNVGHLEAQRGGCCTVMPYWIGKMLEIPLTTTQDYALFHYLREYTIDLWKQQAELILDRHGLISFLIHPDYIIEEKAREVYVELLRYLGELKSEGKVWAALPREVDRWWRARSQMKLVEKEGRWMVEGPEMNSARVAYATLRDGSIVYELPTGR